MSAHHPLQPFELTHYPAAWQFIFFLIASEVGRFRLMMLPAILMKLAFSTPALLLTAEGKLPSITLPFAAIDLCLAVAFAPCFLATRRDAPKSGST